MSKFVRVGIDLGTHQTKICLQRENINGPEFKFVSHRINGEDTFYLPSIIKLKENGTLSYGGVGTGKVFRLFKIAVALDDHFTHVTHGNDYKIILNEDYSPTYPEVLYVLYLTYCMLYVKNNYLIHEKKTENPRKGFSIFSKKTYSVERNEDEAMYQIGIPTEYSDKINLKRRKKFEQLLLMSCKLMLRYESLEQFIEVTLEAHQNALFTMFNEISKIKNWKQVLEEYRLSILPETTAGLVYLMNRLNKMNEGFYVTMDIGGGTSDVSFFKITKEGKIEYLASESIAIGKEVFQNKIESLKKTNSFDYYTMAFLDVYGKLTNSVLKVYLGRVSCLFEKYISNNKFKDSTCYIYGGGSLFQKPLYNPENILEQLELHNNGTISLTSKRMTIPIKPLSELMSMENDSNLSESDMQLLQVARGLAMNPIEDLTNYWVDKNTYIPAKKAKNERYDGYFDIPKQRWV